MTSPAFRNKVDTLIAQLEREGLVTVTGTGPDRVVEFTAKGRREAALLRFVRNMEKPKGSV